jgi:hypothetical protein
VCIGRRNRNQGNIDRQNTPSKKQGHFAKENRDVVGVSGLHRRPDIGPNKTRIVAKRSRKPGFNIGGNTLRVDMNQFDLTQFFGTVAECLNQRLRRHGNAVDKNPLEGSNGFYRIFCGLHFWGGFSGTHGWE